ncbi:hypothetical protein [Pseudoxanthomonas winnipegensis]|uniref:Uncharacterized protein n=1 Tax=Pseudoxanthomonas winnipegensis TaxID=2480810 RepID=A0A4Q8LYZ2_9GAMM|nr:hypothetical protein [Pseudoxanthomonas winnipegensis]RZZ90625.1 hypothetical protein EA663_02400 [Pseudoxanthomonas winnipegensis]TAA37220.1 hypothetical protein EA656_00640 [Pseudoxanthomonas winnipegensis]
MDRKELRLAILRKLEESGSKAFKRDLAELLETVGEQPLAREVLYLQGHGLVTALTKEFDGEVHLGWVQITHQGRDYIDSTGGLGAELGVVTVRLHEDTIRQLLISQVRGSDADDTVKGKLVDQLKALPAEGVSKLAERALEQSLRYMPDVIRWLQTTPWN